MQELLTITGSRARAGILTALLREGDGARTAAELTRAAGVKGFGVRREIRRLLDAGLIRKAPIHTSRVHYQVDPSFTGLPELRRFVRITAGTAGRIRRALLEIDDDQLAWAYGRYAVSSFDSFVIDLVVLTRQKRKVVKSLASLTTGHQIRPLVVSVAEWVNRLEKKELRTRAIRRSYRLWILGDDEQLVREEQRYISSRKTLQHAIANWREELSDEWDDDWDPSKHGRPLV